VDEEDEEDDEAFAPQVNPDKLTKAEAMDALGAAASLHTISTEASREVRRRSTLRRRSSQERRTSEDELELEQPVQAEDPNKPMTTGASSRDQAFGVGCGQAFGSFTELGSGTGTGTGSLENEEILLPGSPSPPSPDDSGSGVSAVSTIEVANDTEESDTSVKYLKEDSPIPVMGCDADTVVDTAVSNDQVDGTNAEDAQELSWKEKRFPNFITETTPCFVLGLRMHLGFRCIVSWSIRCSTSS
jgi:hypothetical protein